RYEISDLCAAINQYEGAETSRAITHIETHISHVFLTEAFAYKIKKPVCFEFLDYTTSEMRRIASNREVELNRRTAADVYLGVINLCRDASNHIVLDGDGDIVDWIVKMRRLPSALMMDEKIASSTLTSDDLDNFLKTLSKFYASTARVDISAADFVGHLRQQIEANFTELFRDTHCIDRDILRRIKNKQLQFLEFNADLWATRLNQRMIVDGHGDLRPEHICLESSPKIFDCVEFNDAFRHLDILDEICFLALECERLGRPDIAQLLLQSPMVAKAYGSRELSDFYISYRACVRAKVAVLRALQAAGDDRVHAMNLAGKYLDLADRGMGVATKPLCLIIRGLIGSGKSTVARRLSERLGMTLIQSDKIRREIYVEGEVGQSYGAGLYTSGSRDHVYEHMLEQALDSLRARTSVIMDACFLRVALQQRVQFQVDAIGIPLVIVNCECPQEIAVTRILERMKDPSCLSDARPEHWLDQARDDEGVISGVPTITLKSASAGPDTLCDELVAYLAEHVIGVGQSSCRAIQESYCDTKADVSRSFETSRLATLAKV
ncbi:MAG: hypothetical protein FJ146_19220, partial [Deltaproteobacteria bacterium]|nr:hypothetical protein [Deltaproteobacteria bacterium]